MVMHHEESAAYLFPNLSAVTWERLKAAPLLVSPLLDASRRGAGDEVLPLCLHDE
jgi:hypothetical protein